MPASALRVAALLALASIAAAAPAAAQDARPNGIFLVAKPGLVDPNFQRSVVLVTRSEDSQTVGVIINRPTPITLTELMPGEPDVANYRETVYFGGPVLQRALIAVFRSDAQPPAPAFPVRRGLYLSMHPDNLRMLLAQPGRQYRLYAGFSGWAPGQLEAEMERDDWYVLPADADIVLRKDMDGVWEELLRRALARKTKSPAWERGFGPGTAGQCRQSGTFTCS
ncbi:MAG: YqgE/AlgH family protein [Betaproteobacteria bacterium]|nr:YqgE/AlgH family protein [Betaproteobacteria bacterium]